MGGLNPIAEFREDHRKVRDGILEITEALGRRDMKKAKEVISRLNILVGPHFRYEEEHLYPALPASWGNMSISCKKSTTT